MAGTDRQRHAAQLSLHRIERGRLGVEGDDALLDRLVHPGLQRRQVADAKIGVDVDPRRHGRLGAPRGQCGGAVGSGDTAPLPLTLTLSP